MEEDRNSRGSKRGRKGKRNRNRGWRDGTARNRYRNLTKRLR